MKPTELLNPAQRLPSKAYLVNELRKAVFTWRDTSYKCYVFSQSHTPKLTKLITIVHTNEKS